VFGIVPSDDFVITAARVFQSLINKRDGTTTTEPSDAAHALAGTLGRSFCRRLRQIPDDAVVEMVIEEELQELVEEFDELEL
jgi:hypothetical protein